MRKFYDVDRDEVITIEQLEKEYNEIKAIGGTDSETFDEYIVNCQTRNNGTLEEIREGDEFMEKNTLCGFVWCHGKEDFSVWEVNLRKEDRDAIEKILSKYETEGSSERNCYYSRFKDVFSEEY